MNAWTMTTIYVGEGIPYISVWDDSFEIEHLIWIARREECDGDEEVAIHPDRTGARIWLDGCVEIVIEETRVQHSESRTEAALDNIRQNVQEVTP